MLEKYESTATNHAFEGKAYCACEESMKVWVWRDANFGWVQTTFKYRWTNLKYSMHLNWFKMPRVWPGSQKSWDGQT